MPHEKGEKARIALLIVVAVLAIALAMLEALADNPPSAATAAPSRLAPPTRSPALNPPATPEHGSSYSRVSAQRSSSSFRAQAVPAQS